jgi:hypothetical protein
MDPTWERRLNETPQAPTRKLSTSLTAERFNSRRVRARRLIVRELDEWFGIFHYPEPNLTYAVPASREREAALDE